MSAFIIPVASFQTQQQLKADMEKRKRDYKKKHGKSKNRASKGENELISEKSIHGKSSRSSRSSKTKKSHHNYQHHNEEDSLDSDISEVSTIVSSISLDSKSSRSSSKSKSRGGSTFNFSQRSELAEILQYNKKDRQHLEYHHKLLSKNPLIEIGDLKDAENDNEYQSFLKTIAEEDNILNPTYSDNSSIFSIRDLVARLLITNATF